MSETAKIWLIMMFLAGISLAGPQVVNKTTASVVEPVFRGKCPVCVKKGYKSTVYQGGSTCTLMAAIPYYDEDGKYHYDDPNITTTSYNCSRGHSFSISSSQGSEKVSIGETNDAPRSDCWGCLMLDCGATNNISTNTPMWSIQGLSGDWLGISTFEPTHSIVIRGAEDSPSVTIGVTNGVLKVKYDGDVDKSAKVVFDWVIQTFTNRGWRIVKDEGAGIR